METVEEEAKEKQEDVEMQGEQDANDGSGTPEKKNEADATIVEEAPKQEVINSRVEAGVKIQIGEDVR